MKHQHCLDQLPFYVAGKVSPAERASLDLHLSGCASCRTALDEWQRIAEDVRAAAANRVRRLPPLRALPLPPKRAKSRQPAITLAAALLVIVLFVGALVLLNQGDQPYDAHPGAVLLTLSATPSPVPSPTPLPSLIPQDEPGTPPPAHYIVFRGDSATPTPAPFNGELTPLPDFVRLEGITYEQQGWNNQGPTALTMALSYYGWTHNQQAAANWLKPNPEDKHVTPWEMVTFVNNETTGVYGEIGVKAVHRLGGDMTLLKRLLAAGFPVIAEVSIQPDGEDWMGHYVLLIGYDEQAQSFLTYDSYLGSHNGQGRPCPFRTFDEPWRQFNRTFIVVYAPGSEDQLRAALGPYIDPVYGYQRALETAQAEASQKREDAWAWFNLGTAYDLLGDYDSAASAYDEALRIGLPWRMLWYQFGPYEAYFFTGRYSDVIASAQATIATTPYVEESYYWRGMAYAAKGDADAAGRDFAQVVKLNPRFFAVQAIQSRASADPLAFGQTANTPVPLAVEATPTPNPSLPPDTNPFALTATQIIDWATATAAAQFTPTLPPADTPVP